MTNYQRFLKETRQARVPLARISNQLRRADKGLKRKAITIAFVSLTALTAASAVLISMQPLTPIRARIAAISPRLGATLPSSGGFDQKSSVVSGDDVTAARTIGPLPGDAGNQKFAANKGANSVSDLGKQQFDSQETGSKPSLESANSGIPRLSASGKLDIVPPGQVVFPDELTSAGQDKINASEGTASSSTGLIPSGPTLAVANPLLSSPDGNTAKAGGMAFASSPASSALLAAIRPLDAENTTDVQSGPIERSQTLGTKSAALSEVPCKVRIQAWTTANLIHFEKTSSSVSAKQTQKLRDLGQALDGCPDVQIDVGGHADKSGEQLGNLQLSWQRAESVIKTMKSLGFKTDRLAPVGYSASRPVARDATPQANAMNRRVEFIVR